MLVNYDADAVAEVMGISFEADASALSLPGLREEGQRMKGDEDFDSAMVANGRGAPSSLLIEKALEQGLPRQVLRTLAERIAGGDKMKVAALEWSIVPKTTLERRQTRLSPQESERTERVARLFVQARRALGSEDEARSFVTAAHPELDGRSPLEAARTDLGTRRAEQVLNALEYGLAL